METPQALAGTFARVASRAQTRLLRADGSARAASDAIELRRLQAREVERRASLDRARQQVRDLMALVAPVLPQECSACGQDLKVVPSARWRAASWVHADAAHEQTCPDRGWPTPAMLRT